MIELNHHDVLIDFMRDKDIRVMGEIGAWKCKMTTRILSTYKMIEQYWATDIWGWNDANNGYPIMSEEWWDSIYYKACGLMYFYPQLRIIKGNAMKINRIFPKRYFDLVYVDADHRYDFMRAVLHKWTPLIKPKGYLVGKAYVSRHKGLIKAVDAFFGENVTIIDNSTVWYHRKES